MPFISAASDYLAVVFAIDFDASSRTFQDLCHLFCKWEERVTSFGSDHVGLGVCVWINPHIFPPPQIFLASPSEGPVTSPTADR